MKCILIHSNLTRIINVDSNYNWYFELYVGLKLPVFCGIREFLLLVFLSAIYVLKSSAILAFCLAGALVTLCHSY